MPELPEVEVLVRHLTPQILGRTIRRISVLDPRSLRKTSPPHFKRKLRNCHLTSVHRRGKYLIFKMQNETERFPVIGHLGMTGRMYLQPHGAQSSKHTTIRFDLGDDELLFEDARRFGGFTLDSSVVDRLGLEPLDRSFTATRLRTAITDSRQAIKARLLDQSVIAGIGNIYASEALFLAQMHPGTPCCQMCDEDIRRLRNSIRRVLHRALRFGSSLQLDFGSATKGEGLFYFGERSQESQSAAERFFVYDREGEPCFRCGKLIVKIIQSARSTYFCRGCQPATRS